MFEIFGFSLEMGPDVLAYSKSSFLQVTLNSELE